MHAKKIISKILLCSLTALTFSCSRAMLEDELNPKKTVNKVVTGMVVTPSKSTVGVGDSVKLNAIATYADNTTGDITDKVTWTAILPNVATTGTQKGEALGVTKGTGVVNAVYQNVTANALVAVTNSDLASIEINPTNQSIFIGVNQSYTATGIYADHSKADLTNQVTWSTTNPLIATISDVLGLKGHAVGVSSGAVTISATYGSVTGSTGLTVNAITPISLAITPQMQTIAAGTKISYIATATMSDGSVVDVTTTVNWSSSSPAIATINNVLLTKGQATGVAAGQTTITASFSSLNATATLKVNAATLSSLAISPINSSGLLGLFHQFHLTGTFSDGSTQDLSEQATWSSSNILNVLMSDLFGSKGQALGLLPGAVNISALYNGITTTTVYNVTNATLTGITIDPASSSLPIGVTKALKAIGSFNDGSTKDITNEVVWSVVNPVLASVSNATNTAGQVTSLATGATTAVATLGSISGSSVLTTTNAVLNSIGLTPTASSMPLGLSIKITATGNYSNGTTADVTNLVRWTTNAGSILNCSNAEGFNGTIYSLLQGSGTVTATLNGVSQGTLINVTAPSLTSITLTPTGGGLISLGAIQFKAMGLYSDGSFIDITNAVTWTAAPLLGLGSINSSGLFIGISIGTVNVTATLGSITKTNLLTLKL